MCLCQGDYFKGDISKRQKKKATVVEGEPEVEIITKVEYIYEDTKATTRVEPDYKWGEIYMMIANQNVPDAGFDFLMFAYIVSSSNPASGTF